jgi:hypothetical protein
MFLADTLSRAYPTADSSNRQYCIEFSEELAALIDNTQQDELRMVASQHTIDLIHNASKTDDENQILRN